MPDSDKHRKILKEAFKEKSLGNTEEVEEVAGKVPKHLET